MRKYSIHSIAQWLIVAVVFALFCYFRLKPIYFQTVPYTYDQGRDFLKAEEMVRYFNPTFIGPTTGIQGLHHGAWWYYFLSIVFFIFNGWPQGFYYGILFFTLLTTFLFFLFLKKNFHFLTALLFLLVVTVSPYFIRISFFPGNNILTPGAVLLFIYSVYKFFQNQKLKFIFLLALSLGLIFETEVSFGFFIIPPFILIALFFKEFRNLLKNKWFYLIFIIGIAIPFLPRLLFNLKNHFIEITDSIHFLKTTPPTNPQSLAGAAKGRVDLFVKYFQDVIYDHNGFVAIGVIVSTLFGIIAAYKRLKQPLKSSILFFPLIIIGTLAFSLLNKNNFFWDNYLEGIHYIYVFLILLGFEALLTLKRQSWIAYLIVAAFALFSIIQLTKVDSKPTAIGLRADVMTIDYLYKQTNNMDFCLRIYTPPIVPYTYIYLISYYSKVKKYKEPTQDFKNNMCWYIIDKESYQQRVIDWRKAQIPQNAKRIQLHTMENGVEVELWKIQ